MIIPSTVHIQSECKTNLSPNVCHRKRRKVEERCGVFVTTALGLKSLVPKSVMVVILRIFKTPLTQ